MTDHLRFEPIRSAPDQAHVDYNGGRLVDAMLRLVDAAKPLRYRRSWSTGVRPMATVAEEQIASWLVGRSFASWRDEFDRRSYLIFERVLPQDGVAEIRAVLAPHLARLPWTDCANASERGSRGGR